MQKLIPFMQELAIKFTNHKYWRQKLNTAMRYLTIIVVQV